MHRKMCYSMHSKHLPILLCNFVLITEEKMLIQKQNITNVISLRSSNWSQKKINMPRPFPLFSEMIAATPLYCHAFILSSASNFYIKLQQQIATHTMDCKGAIVCCIGWWAILNRKSKKRYKTYSMCINLQNRAPLHVA